MTPEVPMAPRWRTRSTWLASAVTVAMAVAALGLVPTRADAIATFVNLGVAESFAVLGGQSVTNTGPSVINGDLGVSPGTSITGFPPGIVNGVIHPSDAVALLAQGGLTAGYINAAGQAPDFLLPSAELGGLTLFPGVYRLPGTAQITGTLTLDALGDPNAVWVFQIASTLITASNSTVSFINGAAPCNVFWQVGSSATIGTDTEFVGTIMALTSISVQTGANIQGRALARNGSVTLDTNVITQSTCAGGGTIGGVLGGVVGGGGVAGTLAGVLGGVLGGTIGGPGGAPGGAIGGAPGGVIGGAPGGAIGGAPGGAIGGGQGGVHGGAIGGVHGGAIGGGHGGYGGGNGGGHGGHGGHGGDDDGNGGYRGGHGGHRNAGHPKPVKR